MIEAVNPSEIPPGGWRWTDPTTGHVMSGKTPEELFSVVRTFFLRNAREIPENLEETILLDMDRAVQADMQAKGLPPYPLVRTGKGPTVVEMTARFLYEAAKWSLTGARVVTQGQYQQRLASCRGCGYWQGESAFGFGRCGKCGCAGLKLWMATSKCPLNPPRWSAVA